MDDSQSSDFFSETGTSIYDVSTVDEESYQSLFNKIKKSTIAKSTVKNVRSEEICKTLLRDCRDCVDQSFNIIISLLEDSTIDIEKVSSYIENVVQILKILSTFIKNIIETIPLTCCTIKTFPTCTGSIIELVFSHCKDSEFIYENHLTLVEKELKELFRSCHELQLTYLMTLQKHFLFDLTITYEQEILLKALDINLKIGEIVQSLDVKTMAEQWKAYTVICEKHSAFLLDKNIYNNCTQLLASSIYKNITTVMEAEEKDKIIVRSLKVASFSLKILLKISSIFKGAKNVDFDCIIQLLCSIKLCDSSYHELLSNKSSEISSLMYGHLSPPSDALILQLINEEEFIKNILSVKLSDFKQSKYLGYILMLISIIKVMMKSQKNTYGVKNKIIDRVFDIIRKCHVWFNIGLKLISVANSKSSNSLYEHLLVHTAAFVATFTSEEYVLVEKMFIESILATDVYASIFTANLWLLLCRMGPNQFHINTLHNLIKMYQVLEVHTTFPSSPQEIHLKYTIKQLFTILRDNEKMAIYKMYNLQEDKNIGIWCALKINNLPENLAIVAEKMVVENLLQIYRGVCENQRNIDKLIKHIQLASTCVFVEHYPELEEFLTSLWSKFCVSCIDVPQKLQNLSSMGQLIFLRNLTYLTNQYKNKFYKNNNVLQILSVMSKLLQLKNAELSTILFETFCELIYHSEYESNLEDLFINTVRKFSNECDIQRQIYTTLLTNKELYDFIIPIFHKNLLLAEIRSHFDVFKAEHRNIAKWQENLEIASDYHFKHKCIENTMFEVNTVNNFEMDFECLFEDEPASKKAKFDNNVENIISDLERNVVQLSEIKDDVLRAEYKDRLESVCEKIRNIVS